MSTGLIDALKVQKRVVWALMLRETKTLFGKHKLGYLWALINAAFQVSVFWVIREVGGFYPPHGMSTPVFLLAGFIPFYIFSNAVSSGLAAIGGNRALLVYPQVYPLDIIIARTTLQGAMQTVVFVLLLLVAALMGNHVAFADLSAIFVAFSAVFLLGFGCGGLCSGLNLIWMTTGQIVPMVIRALFFTSGLFFAIVELPSQAQKILFFNPLCHAVVKTRSAFVEGYGHQFVSMPYLFGVVTVMLALGLLLERYSRRYLDRVV